MILSTSLSKILSRAHHPNLSHTSTDSVLSNTHSTSQNQSLSTSYNSFYQLNQPLSPGLINSTNSPIVPTNYTKNALIYCITIIQTSPHTAIIDKMPTGRYLISPVGLLRLWKTIPYFC